MTRKQVIEELQIMNYQHGLSKLQRRLRKMQDEEGIRQTIFWGAKINTYLKDQAVELNNNNDYPELQQIVNEIDKFAYRRIGMSFSGLCNCKNSSLLDKISSLSVTKILFFVIIIIIILPIFGVIITKAETESQTQSQIEQAQQKVKNINERINSSVMSPFYLEQIDPCDEAVLRTIKVSENLIVSGARSGHACTWHYIDVELEQKTIVIDQWDFDPQGYFNTGLLIKREYFEFDHKIAEDVFRLRNNDCFKQRTFFDTQDQEILRECYTEAGILSSELVHDSLRSPIPPMLYWFFYR